MTAALTGTPPTGGSTSAARTDGRSEFPRCVKRRIRASGFLRSVAEGGVELDPDVIHIGVLEVAVVTGRVAKGRCRRLRRLVEVVVRPVRLRPVRALAVLHRHLEAPMSAGE